eukprot:scaffold7783_cov69-Phaeocystis_antarctica.AAC.1
MRTGCGGRGVGGGCEAQAPAQVTFLCDHPEAQDFHMRHSGRRLGRSVRLGRYRYHPTDRLRHELFPLCYVHEGVRKSARSVPLGKTTSLRAEYKCLAIHQSKPGLAHCRDLHTRCLGLRRCRLDHQGSPAIVATSGPRWVAARRALEGFAHCLMRLAELVIGRQPRHIERRYLRPISCTRAEFVV